MGVRRMHNIKNIFALRFRPDRDTWVAFISGFIVISLSAGMLPFAGTRWEWLSGTILRDLLMIVGFGFVVPLGYTLFVEKKPLTELGISGRRWGLMLFVNLLLAGLLAWLFLSDTESIPVFDLTKVKAILYIMLAAGPFEVLFFYGFLLPRFERAFGVLPGILLAALFYSFHHIGFQPEYGKLFLVGIMYMVTFRAVRSIWIIYPFFWGVGACWDVLVQFGLDAAEVRWANTFWIVGLFVLAGWVFYRRKKRISQKPE